MGEKMSVKAEIFNLNKTLKKVIASAIFIFFLTPQLSFGSIVGDLIDTVESTISLTSFFYDFAAGKEGNYSQFNLDSSRSESLKKGSDKLLIIKAGFSNLQDDGQLNKLLAIQELAEDALIEPAVIGEALCYPNPFRFNSSMGGEIGYTLSKDMEIELRVYNMLAQQIVKRTFPKSGLGGSGSNYNRIKLNKNSLDGYILSAGVYFYLIIHDGEILSRGKMAVKP